MIRNLVSATICSIVVMTMFNVPIGIILVIHFLIVISLTLEDIRKHICK